jgi:RimJ/RimL family protein N-acetyltransferase
MSPDLSPADIAAIERATLAAVAPRLMEALPGWLLPMDDGGIRRAHAAVPLSHADGHIGQLPAIEQRYHAHGLPTLLRLPRVPGFARFEAALGARGYAPERETRVQVAQTSDVRRMTEAPPAMLSRTADDQWASVFLGPGFDPVDGANRIAALGRATDSRYARVEADGATVAIGVLGLGDGWAGIHGMRTAEAHRGRGLAARVLAGLAQAALDAGIQRLFLQVEAHNVAALALYRRAGFVDAWRYRYWRRREAA